MNQNNIKPQELLTGKAKEAFIVWMAHFHGLGQDEFIKLGNRTQLVLYRDFFRDNGVLTEVTKEAIKKAVEIYNKGAM